MDEYVILNQHQFKALCDRRDGKDKVTEKERIEPESESKEVEEMLPLVDRETVPMSNANMKAFAEVNKKEMSKASLNTHFDDYYNDDDNGDSNAAKDAEIDGAIEKGLNRNAIQLFKFLRKRSPDIDWIDSSQMLLSGSLVPDSDIYKLMIDAVRTDGQISSSEMDYRVLRRFLIKSNVPENIVNKNIYKRRKMPVIVNPINADDIPTVRELKKRANAEEANQSRSTVNDQLPEESKYPLAHTQKEKVRKHNPDGINMMPVRKSERIRTAPAKYGRGRKS